MTQQHPREWEILGFHLSAFLGADGHQGREVAQRFLELLEMQRDNPDLPLSFIEGMLAGQAEANAGLAEPIDWSVD